MYNTDLPRRADLPSNARLRRSTVVAFVVAVVLLVTVVLPAEYGVDPTRIGRLLGLTTMGEIKVQLAAEAEADRQAQAAGVPESSPPPADDERLRSIEERLDQIMAVLVTLRTDPLVASAPAAEVEQPAAQPEPASAQPEAWRDAIEITLDPGVGVEFKLVMEAEAEAEFEWTANGGVLNFDAHGDGGGRSISYEKGRSVAADAGILVAAFDGNHGWFWRNRTQAPVTLTLRTRGSYSEFKRTV